MSFKYTTPRGSIRHHPLGPGDLAQAQGSRNRLQERCCRMGNSCEHELLVGSYLHDGSCSANSGWLGITVPGRAEACHDGSSLSKNR